MTTRAKYSPAAKKGGWRNKKMRTEREKIICTVIRSLGFQSIKEDAHTPRRAYRGKKQMNKFAFQNNARQSHIPAPPRSTTPQPPKLTQPLTSKYTCRLSCHTHSQPFCGAQWCPTRESTREPPRPSPPVGNPPKPTFFHSVLSIDQVLNFRVHPSPTAPPPRPPAAALAPPPLPLPLPLPNPLARLSLSV